MGKYLWFPVHLPFNQSIDERWWKHVPGNYQWGSTTLKPHTSQESGLNMSNAQAAEFYVVMYHTPTRKHSAKDIEPTKQSGQDKETNNKRPEWETGKQLAYDMALQNISNDDLFQRF